MWWSETDDSEKMVLSDASETRCLKWTYERQTVRAYEGFSTIRTVSKDQFYFYCFWLSILSSLSTALEFGVVAASDGITSNGTLSN